MSRYALVSQNARILRQDLFFFSQSEYNKKGERYEELWYTCCGDIYDKIFVEMLMCIVGNRGDFFFFSTSDSTTLFCGVLEIPYLALCTSAFLVARQLLI